MGLFGSKEEFETTSKFGKLKVDDGRKLFKINGKVIPYDDLVSFKLLENGEQITEGGVNLGRAAIGGLALGSVGAGFAGLSKMKKQDIDYCTSMQIVVSVKNKRNGTLNVVFVFGKTKKSSFVYTTAQATAQSTLDGFNYVLDHQTNKTEDNDIAALKKWKDMLDMDIITQEDFDNKKREILGL